MSAEPLPVDLPPSRPEPLRPEPRGLPRRPLERIGDLLADRGWGLPKVAGAIAAALALVVVGWWLLRPPPVPPETSLPVETSAPVADAGGVGSGDATGAASTPVPGGQGSTTSSAPTVLVVHAAGSVVHPGLYRLAPDARVADLVTAAGGLAPDADRDRLNLAAPLVDGMRCYVPRRGQDDVPEPVGEPPASAPLGGTGPSGSTSPAGPVDLNTATAEQLDTLPGVGPATAAAIIAYRTEHGRFGAVDDLLEVRGIGDAKLAQLRSLVRV